MIPKTDFELFLDYCKLEGLKPTDAMKHQHIYEKSFHYNVFVTGVRVRELFKLVREKFEEMLKRRFKWVARFLNLD